MKNLIGSLAMLFVFDILTIAWARPPTGSTCTTACALLNDWCAAGGPGNESYSFNNGIPAVPGGRCITSGSSTITPGKPLPLSFDANDNQAPNCAVPVPYVTDGRTDGNIRGNFEMLRRMTIFTDCGAYK